MKVHGTYDRPIPIAEGIYWVGFHDKATNFHCNPYLVVEGDHAVLLDGGSRSDFAEVMMKVLQIGVQPKQIAALIYQHYDPDLCGSMPNLIEICENPNLKILSDIRNNIFLSSYIHREKNALLAEIGQYGYRFALEGRILQFIPTPYSHTAGSFMTYDQRTKTLFTSDLFGGFSPKGWDLFLELEEECFACEDFMTCRSRKPDCPLQNIILFHQRVMPCAKALRHAMGRVKTLDIGQLAPQHGSVLKRKKDIDFLIRTLEGLTHVGIDGLI